MCSLSKIQLYLNWGPIDYMVLQDAIHASSNVTPLMIRKHGFRGQEQQAGDAVLALTSNNQLGVYLSFSCARDSDVFGGSRA